MTDPGAKAVVVVGAHTMALGVVRALGEAGVPVVVLHYDARDMAHVSRYVMAEHRVPPPHTHEPEFAEALRLLATRLGGSMLLPVSDEATVAVARHKEALERDFVVACPAWDVVQHFIEKRRTYQLAAAAGVATPLTAVPSTIEEAEVAARGIGFPLLVKPSQSHLFYERFRRKMVEVRTMAELLEQVGAAHRAGLEVMLQECVPGADSEVVNYNAYSWGEEALVEFTARQLRKAPPRFGSPRVVVSEDIQAIIGPGRAMLKALGFQGYACCEFKRDPRDGAYKILDVNGRHNLSSILAVRCGLNFPLLHYRHLMYGELPGPCDFTKGLYWTDFFRDAAYSLRYLFEEAYSARDYLAPYLGLHCDATFDRRDPRPAAKRLSTLVTSLGGRARQAWAP